MKFIRFTFRFVGLLILISGFLVSPTFSQTKETEFITNQATVSGKISIEGKPAANVAIGIIKASADWDDKPQATAKTDADGKFLLENLPAGSYYLRPEVAGFIYAGANDDESFRGEGKAVILEAGEKLENADIKLVRGAALTGRLTDSEGKPLISEQIKLETYNEKGEKTFARYNYYSGQGLTDDRGVYRFYGLKAGKYIVSFGLDAKKGGVNESNGVMKKSYHSLTYYPSVQNEKDAKIVELNVGETAENIDLRMGKKGQAFKISGKLLNEETGKPFEKERAFVSAIPTEVEADFGFPNDSVKEDGSFELRGFLPGKYIINMRFFPETEFFVPSTNFEINDKDLTNLKIYGKKGLSLSGFAKLENKSQTNIPVNLQSIGLLIFGDQFNLAKTFKSDRRTQIKSDGTFRFPALQSGELTLITYSGVFGLKIAKIEKEGVPLEKINLVEGQSIKDLLVTIRYGTNRLQGEIRFADGGGVPSDSEIRLIAKPTEQGRLDKSEAIADERGKFLLEGLTPEQYDVKVVIAKKNEDWNDSNGKILAQTRIFLVAGVDGQTVFNVNLNQ